MSGKEYYSWFEFVRCDGRIYAVIDDNRVHSKGILGVVDEEIVSAGTANYENEKNTIWLPMNRVERLMPADVDTDTVRLLFRLEKTPWQLAMDGKYPFSQQSGRYVPTATDIVVLLERMITADDVTFDHWSTVFLNPDRPLRMNKADEKTQVLEGILWHHFSWIERDNPHDLEELRSLSQKFSQYASHPMREWVADEDVDSELFSVAEDLSKEQSISDDLRSLYIRVLDDESGDDEAWRSYYRGYAYYGGNEVVACDWHKSEHALLKAYTLHDGSDKAGIANSLGYIYNSNRVGAPDYEKSFRYFSEATAAGIKEARYKLSDLYRLGHGTPVNGEKAFALLKPLYEQELDSHCKGYYGSKLADTALRMGYCARDGIGREKNLRDAYCLFKQAKNAITVRRSRRDHFGDGTVESNIDHALEELMQEYSPESESYVGLVGHISERGTLYRCFAEDGVTLQLHLMNDKTSEMKVSRDQFIPLTERARDVGDVVTIVEGHKSAVVRSASWHFNRGAMSYLLTIDGKESGKWYFEWSLDSES